MVPEPALLQYRNRHVMAEPARTDQAKQRPVCRQPQYRFRHSYLDLGWWAGVRGVARDDCEARCNNNMYLVWLPVQIARRRRQATAVLPPCASLTLLVRAAQLSLPGIRCGYHFNRRSAVPTIEVVRPRGHGIGSRRAPLSKQRAWHANGWQQA